MSELTRCWFEFDKSTDDLSKYVLGLGLGFGCGVTARNYDDALALIDEHLLRGEPMPPIARVVPDIDVSTLDVGHVIPNMGVPIWRGVWFPRI
jgi:hypothetical protein